MASRRGVPPPRETSRPEGHSFLVLLGAAWPRITSSFKTSKAPSIQIPLTQGWGMGEDICIPHLTHRSPDFDFQKNPPRSVSRERNISTAFVPTEKKKQRVFTLSSGNGSQMSPFFFFSCS